MTGVQTCALPIFDGRAAPLAIRPGAAAASHLLQAYPNPSTGTVSLRAEATITAVRLRDESGRVVQQQPLRLAAGSTGVLTLRNGLGTGQYVLETQQANGQWLSTKLHVQR